MIEYNIFSPEEFQEYLKDKVKKTTGAKRKNKEESIQLQVCEYLRKNYPNVIWFCDLASGMKLPIWIAAKHKKMRSSKGLPDLYIAKSSEIEVPFTSRHSSPSSQLFTKGISKIRKYGLFIELKKNEVRLKNGQIAKSDHHAEQEAILKKLRDLNYKAEFACGYDEAVKIIDDYLKS